MPTPFTHLAAAERLLNDPTLNQEHHELLTGAKGAFLLGSIAPDAHHEDPTVGRADTHFFHYQPHIEPPPDQVMLHTFTTLQHVDDPTHAAFIAGYLGHLAMDVRWTEDVLMKHFWHNRWRTDQTRYMAFIALLSIRDRRAYESLPVYHTNHLRATIPTDWLPFLSDLALLTWRDIITAQMKPNGTSCTLQVLGRVAPTGYNGLVDLLQSSERLQTELWNHYTPALLATDETVEYQHMRQVVCTYLEQQLSEGT